MDIEKGADEISKAIEKALQRKEGLLIGRNGTVELETTFFKLYVAKPGQDFPSALKNRMEINAGIFPAHKISLERWVFGLLEAIRNSDVLVAGWYAPLAIQEEVFLDSLNALSPRIPLRSLEPYYVEPSKRWTRLLAGQRVAIVNSFAETAVSQVRKREEVWPVATESLLPSDVEWIPIRTGYSPQLAKGRASWPSDISSWDVAVDFIVKRVIKSGAKMALIGCGGIGMLIGSELKKRGVIAIVLGGATQVLFGIKGNRWANHTVISHFWNDAWVYPKQEETPAGAVLVEGACYWK